MQQLGREPKPEEIAKKLEMPTEKVQEILKISQEPVSMETPVGEEDDSHLGDFIKDDNMPKCRRMLRRTRILQRAAG